MPDEALSPFQQLLLQRLDAIDGSLDRVDQRLDDMQTELGGLRKDVDRNTAQLQGMRERVDHLSFALTSVATQQLPLLATLSTQLAEQRTRDSSFELRLQKVG